MEGRERESRGGSCGEAVRGDSVGMRTGLEGWWVM